MAAALEIAEVVRRAYGGRLRIGIGVNSGPVVAGTIGGGGRVEFAVIGDTVNTAARVEGLTRETNDTVLVTDATCALLRDEHGGFAERGTVTLRGRSEPVTLHVAHGRGGRAGRRAGARASAGSTASPTRTMPGAATSHHTPKATSRLPRRRARARRIGRSPWPSSGSRIVTTQRSVGTATRRVAVPIATSRPAQPSSSHARAPSTAIVIRKRRGSTTAPSSASETAASEPSDMSVTGWSSPPTTPSSLATSCTGAPEVLGQRGGEGPLDEAARHRAPVVERGRDRLAAHDRRRDAPAVGEGQRQLLSAASQLGTTCTRRGLRIVSAIVPVGLADVEGAIADRPALGELERVGLHGPHPLDRGDGEGGDAKHRGMVAW